MKLIVFMKTMNLLHGFRLQAEEPVRDHGHRHSGSPDGDAVAASGSVTRAAGELHLTQSAVSHQLRAIEERLGTPLFLRVGKRMVVTAAGDRVLAPPGGFSTTSARPRKTCGGWARVRRRVLRVCAQCNTGYHWLPPLIDVFRRSHPAVDVSLAVECTIRPLEALLEGQLDVAIVTESDPPRSASGAAALRGRACRDRRARPSASRRGPSSARRTSPTSGCCSIPARPTTASRSRRSCGPPAWSPQRVSFVMLTEAILEMVKARLGVSVMQTWAIEPALRAGDVRAIPITAAGIRRQWRAATLKAAGRVAHVDAFIDLLAAARCRPAAVRWRCGVVRDRGDLEARWTRERSTRHGKNEDRQENGERENQKYLFSHAPIGLRQAAVARKQANLRPRAPLWRSDRRVADRQARSKMPPFLAFSCGLRQAAVVSPLATTYRDRSPCSRRPPSRASPIPPRSDERHRRRSRRWRAWRERPDAPPEARRDECRCARIVWHRLLQRSCSADARCAVNSCRTASATGDRSCSKLASPARNARSRAALEFAADRIVVMQIERAQERLERQSLDHQRAEHDGERRQHDQVADTETPPAAPVPRPA